MRNNRRRRARPPAPNGPQRPSHSNKAVVEISAAGDIPAIGVSSARAEALDILRGLAILMMVFAGQIPYDKPLPAWLFHAQEPPTYDRNSMIEHVFDPSHAGLTFVDLVFPLFLFALGAAIPLALTNRLERGESQSSVIRGAGWRLLQLSWFAVYLGNIRPVNLHDVPSRVTWLFALVGGLLLYPMFTRLPASWTNWQHRAIRICGYGGGMLLLYVLARLHYYPKHLGFQLFRVDVILVALGDMAFFGTSLWVFTRGRAPERLAALAVFLAIRLGASSPGWLQDVWTYAPKNTGWLFAFDYLKYLFIVIPGTVAGELILRWIRSNSGETSTEDRPRRFVYILIALALVVAVLYGYEARTLWETAAICAAACLALLGLVRSSADRSELVLKLTQWGSFWLLLGVLLQPFEGGIKKDPSTMSYYFVTVGLAHYLLSVFFILTDTFKLRRPLSLLAHAGQNPMIAYVSMANLLLPLLALTGLLPLLNRLFASPWTGVLLAALETLVLAIYVDFLSKRKLFWRT